MFPFCHSESLLCRTAVMPAGSSWNGLCCDSAGNQRCTQSPTVQPSRYPDLFIVSAHPHPTPHPRPPRVGWCGFLTDRSPYEHRDPQSSRRSLSRSVLSFGLCRAVGCYLGCQKSDPAHPHPILPTMLHPFQKSVPAHPHPPPTTTPTPGWSDRGQPGQWIFAESRFPGH